MFRIPLPIARVSARASALALPGLSLLGLAACAPEITNTTPAVIPSNATSTYEITASVIPKGAAIDAVVARVLGMDWTMTPIAEGSDQYAVTYFASPCMVNMPYTLRVRYRRQEGDGYSATVETLVDPVVGSHLLTVTGADLSGCPETYGHVFTVDSTADAVDSDLTDDLCQTSTGECTLRAAVMQANATAGHDLINVPNGVHTLTLAGVETTDTADEAFGDLDVTDAVTIRGTSTDGAVVDGNATSRLFDLHLLEEGGFVRLEQLTLRNGFEQGLPGGAVFNRTAFQAHRVVMEGNGLSGFVGSGTCAASQTRICNRGGALFNEGSALIVDSSLRDNKTYTSGIFSGQGGGICNFGESARLVIEGSTLARNTARFIGGLDNLHGIVRVTNSTLYDNSAKAWASDIGNRGGTVALNSVTVARTQQGDVVANLHVMYNSTDGTLALENSIVHALGGFGSGGPPYDLLFSGEIRFGFGNFLQGDLTGCIVSGIGPKWGEEPSVGTFRLRGLADNGGPTETVRVRDPNEGELHLKDRGWPSATFDQRGVARPHDYDGDGNGQWDWDPGALEHLDSE